MQRWIPPLSISVILSEVMPTLGSCAGNWDLPPWPEAKQQELCQPGTHHSAEWRGSGRVGVPIFRLKSTQGSSSRSYLRKLSLNPQFCHTKLKRQCRSIPETLTLPDLRSKRPFVCHSLVFQQRCFSDYTWICTRNQSRYVHTTLQTLTLARVSTVKCQTTVHHSWCLPGLIPWSISALQEEISSFFTHTFFLKELTMLHWKQFWKVDRKQERILKPRITDILFLTLVKLPPGTGQAASGHHKDPPGQSCFFAFPSPYPSSYSPRLSNCIFLSGSADTSVCGCHLRRA